MSMQHLNGDLLCAVDTETTGTEPGKHDIIEICVLPLDNVFKPSQTIMPFHMSMKPIRAENLDFNALRVSRVHDTGFDFEDVEGSKQRICDLILKGVDPDLAADRFTEWFENLGLPLKKRIVPLAHNWPFDREFIKAWLQPTAFEMMFSPRFRDTMSIALYENDRCYMRNLHQYPYPKYTLGYICSQLKIPRPRAHTALDDCVACAEAYRIMMQNSF